MDPVGLYPLGIGWKIMPSSAKYNKAPQEGAAYGRWYGKTGKVAPSLASTVHSHLRNEHSGQTSGTGLCLESPRNSRKAEAGDEDRDSRSEDAEFALFCEGPSMT